MKIRQGFISNSSSSSFVVKIDENNKHLFHYDWQVRKEEILHGEDDQSFDFKNDCFRDSKDILEEQGFAFDKEATEEYLGERPSPWRKNNKVYSKVDSIEKINGNDLGRYTGIAIGEDILDFINAETIKKWCSEEIKPIQSLIEEYGINNLVLLRESDEGYCGYLPKELSELVKTALYEWEYH